MERKVFKGHELKENQIVFKPSQINAPDYSIGIVVDAGSDEALAGLSIGDTVDFVAHGAETIGLPDENTADKECNLDNLFCIVDRENIILHEILPPYDIKPAKGCVVVDMFDDVTYIGEDVKTVKKGDKIAFKDTDGGRIQIPNSDDYYIAVKECDILAVVEGS